MTLQQKVGRIGLVAGPVLALALYLCAARDLRRRGRQGRAARPRRRAPRFAMMAWMATWWMTEAVEIEVTSLLPIVAFPLLGVMPLAATTANYGADVIYLFLGGFVLAMAIQRWGLDRRIAFLTLQLVGTRTGGDRRRDHGCDGVPQHVGVEHGDGGDDGADRAVGHRPRAAAPDRQDARRARRHPAGGRRRTQPRAVAAAGRRLRASIGGLGTIIGSPPNGIFVRFFEQTYGVEVSFAKWMLVGMPTMLLFLPLAWFLNTRVLFPTRLREIEGGRAWIRGEIGEARAAQPRRAGDAGRVRGRPCSSGCSGRSSPAIEVAGVAPLREALRRRDRGGGGDGAVPDPGRSRQGRCSSSTGRPRSSCPGGC